MELKASDISKTTDTISEHHHLGQKMILSLLFIPEVQFHNGDFSGTLVFPARQADRNLFHSVLI